MDMNTTSVKTIDELDLSVRTHQTLARRKLLRVEDLISRTVADISLTAYLGRKGLFEILKKLDEHGLRLKDCSADEYPSIDEFIVTKGQSFCKTRVIEDFQFTPKVTEQLTQAGILEFNQLMSESPFTLQNTHHLDLTSVAEILLKLDDKGYRLQGCQHGKEKIIEEFITRANSVKKTL